VSQNLLDDLFLAAKLLFFTVIICKTIYRKLGLLPKCSGRYLQTKEGYYKKFVYKTWGIAKFE
jgi:hypothetical protein